MVGLERDGGGDALVVGLLQLGVVDLRIDRVGTLHGVGQQHGGVVGVGAVDLELVGIGRVIALLPLHAAGHLLQRGAAFGAGRVGQRLGAARQLGQLDGAQAVTTHEPDAGHAQLVHLAQHRAALRVHAAKEDGVRFLAFDGGQDGQKVGGLVGRVLAIDHVQAQLLGGVREDVGQALAVGGAVVDDGHRLDLQDVLGVMGHAGAQRAVVGDDAVDFLVARLGQVGVGGRAGHHGNAAVVVDLGGWNGGARVQVADHAVDLHVTQLLRDGGALLGVGRVVLDVGFPLDLFAADRDVLLVQVGNGHQHAVGVVLAVVRLTARHGRHAADLDDLLLRTGHATSGHQGRGHGQFQLKLHEKTSDSWMTQQRVNGRER